MDFWRRLQLAWAIVRGKYSSGLRCANRWETTYKAGDFEMFLRIRDMREPDGYSREELVRMLAEVRRGENLSNWSIPEDYDPFAPTQRHCLDCGIRVSGGPTRCSPCARRYQPT